MKETTKMSRAVGQIEKMYNAINQDLWAGCLPVPIITVQSKPGTYGHCTVTKVWRKKDGACYEMNIAAETLDMALEEVLDTIIHEMVHLYCRENQIQEVSRGGTYHNGRFKEIAEAHLLSCYRTEKYGWNTQGQGNWKLIEYALSKGWNEIKIVRETSPRPGGTFGLPGTGQYGQRRPSSTRKLLCPCCGNSVRATKAVRILCMDCQMQMVPQAQEERLPGL